MSEKNELKTVLAHGFAVDEQGRKMSKSIGNVIDPQDIVCGNETKKTPALGVDVLRWWVAGHSLQHTNIPVSKTTLDDSIYAIKKIRNSMKFLLGSIHDLPPEPFQNPRFHMIDQYILMKTEETSKKIAAMYDVYEFNKVCMHILNFLVNDFSSLYCSVIKDRLYCDGANSERRRAVQVTMNKILHELLIMIGPIVPLLAEEVFSHHPHNKDKLHFFHGNWKQTIKVPDKKSVSSVMEKAIRVKERLSKEKPVNIDVSKLSCHIHAEEGIYKQLKVLQDVETSTNSELVELLQASEVSLIKCSNAADFTISIEVSKNHMCGRCRKYTSHEEDSLCQRCQHVIHQ